MKNTVQQRLMATIAVGAMMAPLAPVYAQNADNAEDDSDRVIVVTAKGREQILQDVPLSIAVLNEAELEERGISNVQELADFTPNLEINSPTAGRDTVISVRGLGVSTTDEKYQSVGFFVDGIWMGGQVVGLSTADVERIEVIKGPHSTFGRATYGASIDYVTKTPSLDDLSGSVKLQYSGNRLGVDPNYEASGNISGPIIPGALSFSLFAQQRFDSGVAPAEGALNREPGEQESTIFSGVIYAQLGENTSLKIRGMYTENDNNFVNAFESRPQYWLQEGADVVVNANGQAWIRGAVPDPIRERFYGSDVNTTHLAGTEQGTIENERYFVSAILEHEFNNGMSIRYAGSYMEQDEDALFDGFAPPGRLGGIDPVLGDVSGLTQSFGGGFNNVIGETWEEMSHSLRLFSAPDGPLTWSIGAFYYDSENANFTPDANRVPTALGNTTGLNRIEEIEQWAVFGEVAYQFTDQFRLSVEGRYQEETVGRVAVPNALFGSQRLGTGVSVKEPNFDPRITLSFEPNENHHLYALYAEGHKSGRYNLSIGATLPDGTSSTLPDGTRDPRALVYVEPESLKNYELGWKGNFLDGRVRMNVAAFYQDINNQQFVSSVANTLPPPAPALITQLSNVGKSEIYGFEADVTWAVSDRLTLQGAVGYNDQSFQNDVPPPNGANRVIYQLAGDAVGSETIKGRSFENVSKFSANVSATYTVPVSLGNMFDQFSVRGDVLHRGKKFVDGANLAYIPANTRFNLRTSLTGENWELSFFALNLLDDKTAARGNAFPCGIASITDPGTAAFLGLAAPNPATNLAGGQRCLYLTPSPSRELGVSLKMKF